MRKAIQPKLRFPEFNDNWSTSTLGSIAEFSKGKGVSKSDIVENGSLECIRYGELYTHYGEVIDEIKSRTNLDPHDLVLSEKNDVIIPASGETQIDIATASCVMKSGVALGGDLNIIKSPINGVFLSYYLNNKKKNDIASIAQGISVVHLYASQLKTITLNIPKKDEQQKIASFLTSFENHITFLKMKKTVLEQYKYGLMQQFFSQKIRLQDENGINFPDWEEKKIGDLFITKRGSVLSKNDIVEDGVNFCIHYGELFTYYKENINKIKSRTNVEGTLSRPGDILMPSSDVTPFGLATASAIFKENVVIGGDINILRPKVLLDSLYFSYYLNYSKKEIIKLVTGTTVKHIYNKDIEALKLKVSDSIEEQKIISKSLYSIDLLIKSLSDQINVSINFKMGLLQKMFV